MLRIVFKDDEIKEYEENEYTDYHYDGKVFVVINDKQWIGIYNIDVIAAVEYKKGRYDEVFSS